MMPTRPVFTKPTLLPLAEPRALLRFVLLTLCGAALITLSAKVQIPFWPVPMTLHVLAIMALAVAFGPALATGAVLAYLAAGAIGWPLFSGTPARGIGLAYMMGPTGGYLAGMPLAAWLVGRLAARGGSLRLVLAMLAGLAAIYLPGLFWLAHFVPAGTALTSGFMPFILGDLVKVGLVVAGASLGKRWLARRRGLQA